MAWELDICGDEAISMPESEKCDECEQFRQELERLSDLVDQIQDILPEKQDKLTAGENITIDEDTDVISAKDTTYSQGDGIEIDEARVISALMTPDNTYTKEEVDELLRQVKTSSFEEVNTLPTEGATNIIYLVPNTTTGGHDMYIWDATNSRWIPLGKDSIDLANYLKKTDLTGVAPISYNNSNGQISHNNSGVTANTYGPGANVNGTNGTTINVPQITVNATGHVTGVTNRVLTNVNTDTNTTYGAVSTTANGLMTPALLNKLNAIGARYSANQTVTLSSGVETQVATVSVPAGVYVISSEAFFGTSGGYTFLNIRINGVIEGYGNGRNFTSSGNMRQSVNGAWVRTVSGGSPTIAGNAWNSKGGSVTVRLEAVRIA